MRLGPAAATLLAGVLDVKRAIILSLVICASPFDSFGSGQGTMDSRLPLLTSRRR